jgi:hypothetical protein
VYSQNIVGYANVVIALGNGTNYYCNPFNHPTNNSATNLFTLNPLNDNGDNPNNLLDGISIKTFTGSGFLTYVYNSFDTPGNHGGNPAWAGWSDGNNNVVTAPILNPGTGWLMGNSGVVITNTFLGDVFPGPGVSNVFGIPNGNRLIGSVLPVAGNQTDLTSPLPAPLNPINDNGDNPNNYWDGITISRWTGSGFLVRVYNSFFTKNNNGVGFGDPTIPADVTNVNSGWAVDAAGTAPATRPNIPIGQGFMLGNPNPQTNWVQYFQNQP